MAEHERSRAVDNQGVLTICPSASAKKIDELMGEKFAQLEAAAFMTYGGSGEDFRILNDMIQDNYMWMLSRQIVELRALHEAYSTKVRIELKAARRGTSVDA